jgi:hypothetical protein
MLIRLKIKNDKIFMDMIISFKISCVHIMSSYEAMKVVFEHLITR